MVIHIEIFTDPMMGLSYESEPFLRYLETHFEGNITFSYTMSGLVRDVHDFMTSDEIALGEEKGIATYNQRLATIYKAEENISGLPMNMENFKLFTPKERSTILLNLAYKAVELTNPELAESFLYLLRYKTVAQGRQTTKKEEILKVAKELGLDVITFNHVLGSDEVQENLKRDFHRVEQLKIYSLPAYFISFEGKSTLLQGFTRLSDFLSAIYHLTMGKYAPKLVLQNQNHLLRFLKKHPLISLIELQVAYDFQTLDDVRNFIAPLVETGRVRFEPDKEGNFIRNIS